MESGCLYHIYNRGNNRETIFKEEKNYLFFLERFHQYLSPWVEVHAYCLMPNHFHMLIRVREIEAPGMDLLTEITNSFRNFFTSYAKAINKAYGRTGSLFQYKFKRKEIDSEVQYGVNVAYIHFNPVKAKLSSDCSGWRYSSFNAILSDKPTYVERASVLEWFGGRNAFLDFHEQYWKYHQDKERDFREFEDD